MENILTVGEIAAQTVWFDLKNIVIPEDARWHSPENIEETAQSLKKNKQLQEIVVVPLSIPSPLAGEGGGEGTQYEVRAGVGRVLAAQKLGWEKIRCNIRPAASEYEKRMITFEENEKRSDASPLYQAKVLQQMLADKGGSQRDLAEDIGKPEEWVSEYLGLLNFSAKVQKNLVQTKLNLSQLRAIRALEGDEAQLKAAKEIEEGGLTVKESKKVVQKHLEAHGKAPKAKKPAADLAWNGEEIAINRRYKPAEESAESYIAWLTQALPAFSKTGPQAKPVDKQPKPAEEAIVQAITEPVREAATIA
jgi:ParB/RepB/Spo0J family partition protein